MLWSAAIAVVGAVAAAVFAAASGWSARDTVITVAIAGGSALVASLGGAFVLRRFSGRSTRAQALVDRPLVGDRAGGRHPGRRRRHVHLRPRPLAR